VTFGQSRGNTIRLTVTPSEFDKAESIKESIHNSIVASPLVEYKGKQVPYTIRLRRAWFQKSIPKDEPYLDYWFDMIGLQVNIQILSSKERDISSLESFPDIRLKTIQQEPNLKGAQIRLIDSSPMLINGQNWMSAHIEIILENKETIDEHSRAYLGDEGTIYLIGVVANNDAFSLRLVEESLNSIKVDSRDNSRRKGNVP
jgi:hypothetical protein